MRFSALDPTKFLLPSFVATTSSQTHMSTKKSPTPTWLHINKGMGEGVQERGGTERGAKGDGQRERGNQREGRRLREKWTKMEMGAKRERETQRERECQNIFGPANKSENQKDKGREREI